MAGENKTAEKRCFASAKYVYYRVDMQRARDVIERSPPVPEMQLADEYLKSASHRLR